MQLHLLIIWLWSQVNQTSQVAFKLLMLTTYHFKVFWFWHILFKKNPFEYLFAPVVSLTRLLWYRFIKFYFPCYCFICFVHLLLFSRFSFLIFVPGTSNSMGISTRMNDPWFTQCLSKWKLSYLVHIIIIFILTMRKYIKY